MTTPTLVKPLTGDDALDLLRKVVADAGHQYVYVNEAGQRAGAMEGPAGAKCYMDCAYVHGEGLDARPGCLVGTVLHRHGVPLVVLKTYEGSALGTFGVDAGFTDEDGQEILHAAQMAQDRGLTWGQALAAAEERMEKIIELREDAE